MLFFLEISVEKWEKPFCVKVAGWAAMNNNCARKGIEIMGLCSRGVLARWEEILTV